MKRDNDSGILQKIEQEIRADKRIILLLPILNLDRNDKEPLDHTDTAFLKWILSSELQAIWPMTEESFHALSQIHGNLKQVTKTLHIMENRDNSIPDEL